MPGTARTSFFRPGTNTVHFLVNVQFVSHVEVMGNSETARQQETVVPPWASSASAGELLADVGEASNPRGVPQHVLGGLPSVKAVNRLLTMNLIHARTGGWSSGSAHWFRFESQIFRTHFEVDDEDAHALETLVSELTVWRVGDYLRRRHVT